MINGQVVNDTLLKILNIVGAEKLQAMRMLTKG
jgi:hypothetical protein